MSSTIQDLPSGNPINATTDYIAVAQKQGDGSYKTVKSLASLGGNSLLGKKTGINLNSTLDQQITLSGGSNYVIADIMLTNLSISRLNFAADGEIWTVGRGLGTQIFFSTSQSPTGIGVDALNRMSPGTALSWYDNYVIELASGVASLAQVPKRVVVSSNSLYFSLGTPEGSACTGDMYVYGYVIS